MPTQKQGTALTITRVCLHKSTRALAGACPKTLQITSNIYHYRTGILLNQKHTVRSKKSTYLQCPLCQKADNALHFLSGCQHTIISGMITERHMLPAGSSWKPSAKALRQIVWSIWMLEVLTVWPNKIFEFLSMLMTGHYPAGFLMLVYLYRDLSRCTRVSSRPDAILVSTLPT